MLDMSLSPTASRSKDINLPTSDQISQYILADELQNGNGNESTLVNIINAATVQILSAINGSGTIVGKNDRIYEVLTAWHVLRNIQELESVQVKTVDGEVYNVIKDSIRRIGNTDLAVFKFSSDRHYHAPRIRTIIPKRADKIIVAGIASENKHDIWIFS
jgi:hypothetical protein